MAKIFISYSRVDLSFVEQLYHRLQQMRPNFQIWYDQAPHGLLGGDSWWDAILDAIKDCDIFIYVLSNESVQSRYCQAEFEEACRLQKRVITIQARDRTRLTDKLGDIQYVDMKHGVNDPEALVKLSGALERQLGEVRRRRALWQPRTARPTDEILLVRSADAPEVDTPLLQALGVKPTSDTQTNQEKFIIKIILASIAFILILISIVLNLNQLFTRTLPSVEPTTPLDSMLTTKEVTQTATKTPIPIETPTHELDMGFLLETLDAQATLDQSIVDVQITAIAQATEYTIGTQSIVDQNSTLISLTQMPTINITASIDTWNTQQDVTKNSQPQLPTELPFFPTDTPTYLLEENLIEDVISSSSGGCKVQAINSFATVRNGLGDSSTSLMYLPLNQIFSVIDIGSKDDGTIWWKIDSNELPITAPSTWVEIYNVMELNEACNDLILSLNISEDIFITVKSPSANIRNGPSIDASIIRNATQGESFKISDRGRIGRNYPYGWWFRVDLSINGQESYGWVYETSVKVTPIIEFPDWWFDD